MASRSALPLLLGLGVLVLTGLVLTLILVDEDPVTGRPGLLLRGAEETGAGPPASMDLPGGVARAEGVAAVQPPPDAAADGRRRTVSGRVLRASDDTPLAGCGVRASAMRGVLTDANGGFTLTDVSADAGFLEVGLAGPLPGADLQRVFSRSVQVELPAGSGDLLDLELLVDTGGVVRGQVLSTDGVPLGKALVMLGVPGVPATVGTSVVTDAGGRFLLRDVPVGDTPVTAQADKHAPDTQLVQLADGGPAPWVEFRLVPCGAVVGRVLDQAGGPLAGQHVKLVLELGEGLIRAAPLGLSAVTDAEGHYAIECAPPGTYAVLVGPPGPNPDRIALVALGYVSSDSPQPDRDVAAEWRLGLVVEPGRDTPLDVTLSSAVTVSGRVVDGSGRALPGAVVSARNQVSWLVPGRQEAYTTTLRGVVVRVAEGDDGRTWVHLRRTVSASVVDETGGYEVSGLPAGEISLRAGGPKGGDWVPAERLMTAQAGRHHRDVDFVLSPGRALTGRVFDAQGRAAEGAQVRLMLQEEVGLVEGAVGQADSSGRFRFAGLSEDEVQLYVTHEGHQAQWLTVSPGGAELRIDLQAAPQVTGQVLDAFTLEPVTSYELVVDSDVMRMSAQWSDPEGRFVLDSLEQGVYSVTISAAGYRTEVLEGVVPRFDAPPLRVLLTPH